MEKVKESVQDIAKVMLDNLEHKTRTNGADYVCNKVSVDWQKDIIRKAHGDKLPDDWTYQFIEDALLVLADSKEGQEEEAIEEIGSDVYTHDLTAWLHSSNSRAYYLTEALTDYGTKDGFNVLAIAQQIEKQEVAGLVLQGIREYIKE